MNTNRIVKMAATEAISELEKALGHLSTASDKAPETKVLLDPAWNRLFVVTQWLEAIKEAQ